MPSGNPILAFARHQGVTVLDGGLATVLEASGQDLNDPLWSAKVLIEAPDVVHDVHQSFLAAGADCIASATYQATLPGFAARGLAAAEGIALLEAGVRIAADARDDYWRTCSSREARLRPLVAASLGPYGAFLADGSEYRGDYGLDVGQLYDFHQAQWSVLARSGADVIACETIPSGPEVEALLRLVEQTPRIGAWISLSCRDGENMADGTSVTEVARACGRVDGVLAVGVNCVPPDRVAPLLDALAAGTDKPLLAYPNSGERYEPRDKSWSQHGPPADWIARAPEWRDQGAVAIGGCCRTTPADIARLRAVLLDDDR